MPGSMSGLHGCFSFAFNDYLLSVTRLLDDSRQPRGFTTMQADKERKVLVCWYNANHCVRMHIWDQHLSGAVSYWQHDLTLPLNHSILLWDREWLQNGYSDKRNLKCTVSFISLYVRHKSLLVTLIGLLVTMTLASILAVIYSVRATVKFLKLIKTDVANRFRVILLPRGENKCCWRVAEQHRHLFSTSFIPYNDPDMSSSVTQGLQGIFSVHIAFIV